MKIIMQWRNTRSRYGLIAASLHWTIVAGIIAQYFLAEAAEEREGALGGATDPMSLHTSLGVTILALAILRVVWRLIDPAPARPPGMKRYEVVLARAVHIAFYVLLFAIPLSGWMLTSIEDGAFSYFGWFDLPALRAGGYSKDVLEEVHEVLFNTLFVLALLHVAAALKHRFIDRDNVLKSMLPGP